MRTVRQLLDTKSAEIHSISPDAPVIDAIRLMAERRIGALLVMDGQRLAGCFQNAITRGRSCCRGARPRTPQCATS